MNSRIRCKVSMERQEYLKHLLSGTRSQKPSLNLIAANLNPSSLLGNKAKPKAIPLIIPPLGPNKKAQRIQPSALLPNILDRNIQGITGLRTEITQSFNKTINYMLPRMVTLWRGSLGSRSSRLFSWIGWGWLLVGLARGTGWRLGCRLECRLRQSMGIWIGFGSRLCIGTLTRGVIVLVLYFCSLFWIWRFRLLITGCLDIILNFKLQNF